MIQKNIQPLCKRRDMRRWFKAENTKPLQANAVTQNNCVVTVPVAVFTAFVGMLLLLLSSSHVFRPDQ